MFQFTTSTIINTANAVDVEGNNLLDNNGAAVLRYRGDRNQFLVPGTGTFKSGYIQSVYKRVARAAVKEVITIVIPAYSGDVKAGELLRLTVNTRLQNKVQSNYTNFQYDTENPQSVDIIGLADASANAAKFALEFNKLRTQYNHSYFTAKATGATLTLTVRDSDQRLSAKLEMVYKLVGAEFTPKIVSIATSTVTTPGESGFGDAAWLLRTVMLPTYENTRHFGAGTDAMPILGVNYTQYTLRYMVPSGEDCIWNRNKKSVTTHVFWVGSGLVTAFEDALKTVFADIEEVTNDPKQNEISSPGGETDSNEQAIRIVGKATMGIGVGKEQTLRTENSSGTVTYTSGTTTVATVAGDKVTGVAVGNTVITATDANAKVATFTITVK